MKKMCQARVPEEIFEQAICVTELRGCTLTELIIEGLRMVIDKSVDSADQLIESRAASLKETANQLRKAN
jgi:hypothetical protein